MHFVAAAKEFQHLNDVFFVPERIINFDESLCFVAESVCERWGKKHFFHSEFRLRLSLMHVNISTSSLAGAGEPTKSLNSSHSRYPG